MAQKKIGRNDDCPCGSGKKYKRCCAKKGGANPFARSMLEPQKSRHLTERAAAFEMAKKLHHSCFTPEAALAITRGEKVPGMDFHPWVLARLRDLTKVGTGNRPPAHTISSVRAMGTGVLFELLSQAGVVLDAEGYRAVTVGHCSAWELSESWTARSTDERELLGLVSCELWCRLQREPPSLEMLDLWMQEGYEALDDRDPEHACLVWIRVWELLLERLPTDVRSIAEADAVFPALNPIKNWMGEFEIELHNVALRDEETARQALDLFQRLEQRFADGPELYRLRLQRSEFHYMLGELAEGEALLCSLIDEDPDDGGAYGYLAAHLGSEWHGGAYQDMERAIEVLEGALARPVHNARDFGLESRLESMRDRAVC